MKKKIENFFKIFITQNINNKNLRSCTKKWIDNTLIY